MTNTHASRYDVLTTPVGAVPPTRVSVRTHGSALDVLTTPVGTVPPTRNGVRLFSSRNGLDPAVYAGVIARRGVRSEMAARCLAKREARQTTLADGLARHDVVRTPTLADGLARRDARQAMLADGLARRDIKRSVFATAVALHDIIKTPTVIVTPALHGIRQATDARVPALHDIIKTPIVLVTPALHDVRQTTRADCLARFSISLRQSLTVVARRNSRRSTVAAAVAVRDARGTAGQLVSAQHHAMVPPGWHVYARNTATGAETLLGFISQAAVTPELVDVALGDGTWEIEARPAEFFWDECRTRRVTTVVIAGGEVFSSGLPVIQDLRATVTSGTAYIRWRVAGSYSAGAFRFGLWFSATSPVSTAGAPDASKSYIVGQGDYLALRMQADAEFVAVAAYTDLAQGPSAELELPWSSSPPISPPDQHAQRQ